jgi:hypothetical protein
MSGHASFARYRVVADEVTDHVPGAVLEARILAV